MNKYKGICLSGPCDGKTLSGEGTLRMVYIPSPDLDIASSYARGPAGDDVSEQFIYEYVAYWRETEGGERQIRGFWVPQGKDVFWAIDHLATGYVDNALQSIAAKGQ